MPRSPAVRPPGQGVRRARSDLREASNLANTFVSPVRRARRTAACTRAAGTRARPRLVYKINDPGMSAVWCVIPAVKAAIGTGMIDSANVGLSGPLVGRLSDRLPRDADEHLQGGGDRGRAAHQHGEHVRVRVLEHRHDASIFEDSQGRFKGNVAENYDAYVRNSPVFHAQNVKTPLIILADDKDGAVDFNQGITYYNTLAQQKDVAARVRRRDRARAADQHEETTPSPEGLVRPLSQRHRRAPLDDQGHSAHQDGRVLAISKGPTIGIDRPVTIALPPSPDIEDPKTLGSARSSVARTKNGSSTATGRHVQPAPSRACRSSRRSRRLPFPAHDQLAQVPRAHHRRLLRRQHALRVRLSRLWDGSPRRNSQQPDHGRTVRAGVLLQRRDAVDDRLRQHRPERCGASLGHDDPGAHRPAGLRAGHRPAVRAVLPADRGDRLRVALARRAVPSITAFMFRVTNGRSNQIVEIEAKVLFSRIEGSVRKYDELKLERSRVTFFLQAGPSCIRSTKKRCAATRTPIS